MNINTLNSQNTNLESNNIDSKKEEIINNTKVQTQALLEKTPLEILKNKKDIIVWKADLYSETKDNILKWKLIKLYSTIYEQNPREAISIRDEVSSLARKAKWDKKRNLVELCAGFYNNQTSMFAA